VAEGAAGEAVVRGALLRYSKGRVPEGRSNPNPNPNPSPNLILTLTPTPTPTLTLTLTLPPSRCQP
jgi:hypothetical protein